MDKSSIPRPGQIVKVIRGRDSDKYAVVIDVVDERYVLIADGDKRKFDNPKKKNILHLELQDEISNEVVNSLNETSRVTNGKLRFSISRYLENIQTDEDLKGE
ncbi:KOW domain-containing RNA-binding protein [Chengkuizengella sp. SCS-71B]|uniref:KOW domain-containing RNA-binding protein n=1 Tax=Chengkuizengella sp. SCS-71B TaxID=3115290 RepID=UPI0032C22968